MTILILAEILAGAFILHLLFLLARTITVIGFDALPEVLDKTLIWVQHGTH